MGGPVITNLFTDDISKHGITQQQPPKSNIKIEQKINTSTQPYSMKLQENLFNQIMTKCIIFKVSDCHYLKKGCFPKEIKPV